MTYFYVRSFAYGQAQIWGNGVRTVWTNAPVGSFATGQMRYRPGSFDVTTRFHD